MKMRISKKVHLNTTIGLNIINSLKNSKRIYIEKESKENIIKSQNSLYVKFKTSQITDRVSFFTDVKINSSKAILNLNMMRFVKINKKLNELQIMRFMPNILIKIHTILFGNFLKKLYKR